MKSIMESKTEKTTRQRLDELKDVAIAASDALSTNGIELQTARDAYIDAMGKHIRCQIEHRNAQIRFANFNLSLKDGQINQLLTKLREATDTPRLVESKSA